MLQAAALSAEQLPLQRLTVADGLASDNVTCLFEDGSGRLWIGTGVGLSRYDGRVFRSYSVRDGLSHPWINEIAQTPDGTIWVATGAGLDRLRSTRGSDGLLFEPVDLGAEIHSARSLTVDSAGALWAAVGAQVRRLPPGGVSFEEVPIPFRWLKGRVRSVQALRASPDGSVWIASTGGLFRIRPDGEIVRYLAPSEWTSEAAPFLEVDPEGRVWFFFASLGILVLSPPAAADDEGMDLGVRARARDRVSELRPSPGRTVLLNASIGVPEESVTGIVFDGGRCLLSSYKEGLFVLENGRVRHLGVEAGFPETQFQAILVDRSGNLWIGTGSSGLLRVVPGGFSRFTTADGLKTRAIASVFLDREGRIIVDGFPPGTVLHRFDGTRFRPVELPIPSEANHRSWGLSQVSLQDHFGRWWIPTTKGLYRFDSTPDVEDLAGARPAVVYHAKDGLGGEEVFRLFEDSRGAIWAGVFGEHSVVRWDPESGLWSSFGSSDGLPGSSATAFAEDLRGAVWIGFYSGGIARFRAGTFDVFGPEDGVPPGFVFALEVDSEGRLWMGTTRGGLGRTEDPAAEEPIWRRITTREGLASDGVLALVDDTMGSMWIGSMNGLDRLNIASGAVEHLDTRDGLVANSVISACRDRNGDLWFGTGTGVSRLRPREQQRAEVPAVLIEGVLVSGLPASVPELGAARVGPIRCPIGAGNIEVRFEAPSLSEGHRLRFRYRLGEGETGWSEPLEGNIIRLGGLGSGRYTLGIRAETGDGRSGPVGRVDFLIPPPLWRRWYFQAGIVLTILAALLAWHRARLRRLIAVQRVREHIASDLHDEFGLSLSRISILSEVARQQAGAVEGELEIIGETARDLIDATSDMAWALDPEKDTLGSVVARVRRLAGDICEGSGVRLEIAFDPSLKRLPLGSETRRHLLLILKEAIHNALRHGNPSLLALQIDRTADGLVFMIRDDGSGFDPAAVEADDRSGHGLTSMRRRAEALGGSLEIHSLPEAGTTLSLKIPLKSA